MRNASRAALAHADNASLHATKLRSDDVPILAALARSLAEIQPDPALCSRHENLPRFLVLVASGLALPHLAK